MQALKVVALLAVTVLSIVAGGLLAARQLILIPAQVVRTMPPAAEREHPKVYWVRGKTQGGDPWHAKRAQLVGESAQSILLTEAELNTWARSAPDVVMPERPTPNFWDVEQNASTLNFHYTADGKLQITVMTALVGFPRDPQALFRVVGSFASDDGGTPRFVVEKASLGSLPLRLGFAQGLFHRVAEPWLATEEAAAIREAWGRLETVKVEDELLQLIPQGVAPVDPVASR